MGRSLVIVESPAKAKTINKYLGKNFIVKSSIGHIRDLPTSGSAKKTDPKERARQAAYTRTLSAEDKIIHKQNKAKEQLINRMGIDPEHNWQAQYEVLPGKEKVVNELIRLANSADAIYLATDLDREGEAIAWHLQEVIGNTHKPHHRVVFNEITKDAIAEAFNAPSELNMNRVHAQQARRFLDRVVGFMVSPLLWSKVARGLSAGRVQSVAVRLIVEREREIRAFIPEEYWESYAHVEAQQELLRLQVIKQNGHEYRPVNEAQANAAKALLEQSAFEVVKREDKPTKSRPSPPFITSTLQQAASTRLNFGVKKTMILAQRLYEAGYITYMRTDSTNLSQQAVASAREYLQNKLGDKYVPDKPRFYSSKQGAQEAHEAIRPSDVRMSSRLLANMEDDAKRLYDLIWQRFLACQASDAQFISTSVRVQAGEFELRTRGRIIRFDGHLKILPPTGKGDEDIILPDVQEGQQLNLQQIENKQHFTKPAPRYSEAALVKELEKRGIGRPSTYASIISTIQERGYVSTKGRRFYAEKMGDIVTSRLTENFTDFMDYSFTANMEEKLDDIAQGEDNWQRVLDSFYHNFTEQLQAAEQVDGGMRLNDPVDTDIKCPACSRTMQVRTGTTGVFLGCSGYNLPPKERCTQTLNLVSGEEVISADEDEEAESRRLMNKRRCKLCDAAMESYLLDAKRKLHICGNNPDCSGIEVEDGEFKIKGYDGPILECDKCTHEMQLKTGRFGKYFGCTNSECKNTRKLLKNGQAAPPKMDPIAMPELACQKVDDTYLLRDGASGLFLAASQFPKNRETRPPLVSELLAHQHELPEKYHFLLAAPLADNEGNPSVIRFSRKNKEQYVMSEKEGKATGWSALYQDGKWVINEKKTRPKAAAKKSGKKK